MTDTYTLVRAEFDLNKTSKSCNQRVLESVKTNKHSELDHLLEAKTPFKFIVGAIAFQRQQARVVREQIISKRFERRD